VQTPAVVDVAAVRLFVMAVAGWWADQRQETVAYLVEENRILRAHLRGRIRLTDEERVGWRCTDTGWAVADSVRSPRSSRGAAWTNSPSPAARWAAQLLRTGRVIGRLSCGTLRAPLVRPVSASTFKA
jgi:hypothetical protein